MCPTRRKLALGLLAVPALAPDAFAQRRRIFGGGGDPTPTPSVPPVTIPPITVPPIVMSRGKPPALPPETPVREGFVRSVRP